MAAQPWRRSQCFQDAAGLPLTNGAARIMAFAELEAQLLGHTVLGTQHVLLSLLENDDGLTMTALGRAGARLTRLRSALDAAEPCSGQQPADRPILGAEATAMLAAAGRLAVERGDEYVVERDLLNAVLITEGQQPGRWPASGSIRPTSASTPSGSSPARPRNHPKQAALRCARSTTVPHPTMRG